jgi:predicted ATPase/class 3 adenylate cyclase
MRNQAQPTGSPPPPARTRYGRDVSTSTFVFSDIEGSTRLWQAHPEAMKSALAVHDSLIADAVSSQGGRVFKHTGDGMAAVFSSARDAVVAASEIQRGLANTKLPAIGELRVRIGIHTGEAEDRDGDFFGEVVSRTARLMSVGHGGQTLVSQVAAQLADLDSFPFQDLGEHRLRDLSRPERIYELVVEEVGSDFPPLRTLDQARHNLPILTTSFVGRDQEVSELAKLVLGSRLVTVTGVGGSGKTRVALQAVANLVAEFSGGIWFVELAPVADPDRVDDAVGDGIGVSYRTGASVRESILAHFDDRPALLVIDNCEHVIDAAADLVEEIVTHAQSVRIVATSRELLSVPGEVSYGLRSMRLPTPGDDAVEVRHADSVRLFEERAMAARPDFRLTRSNAGAVVEICRRLDGMPLAIELAAARLRSFSPAQVAEHLDQRFRLLTGGSRTALPRQQTLTATIEWSYRLLDESEQALFRRLSVFQGGFTYEAVAAICAGPPVDEFDILELIPALVDKSLVVAEDRSSGVRYRLLETIRQFGRDRLDDEGQADVWRERHARHFAALSRMGTTLNLNGPDRGIWVERLTTEMDNIRQATTWAIGVGDAELAADAMYGFSRILAFQGHWSEPVARYEEVIAQGGGFSDEQRAETLTTYGSVLMHSPRRVEAIDVLREAVDIYRRSGSRRCRPCSPRRLSPCPHQSRVLAVPSGKGRRQQRALHSCGDRGSRGLATVG